MSSMKSVKRIVKSYTEIFVRMKKHRKTYLYRETTDIHRLTENRGDRIRKFDIRFGHRVILFFFSVISPYLYDFLLYLDR